MFAHTKTTPNTPGKPAQSRGLAACLIATFALPAFVLAADNPGSHEHGRAQLQMALEGSEIDLVFTSPAYNLAGFEHEARTADEKKRLADINDWLETTPLINTEAGACAVKTASVHVGGDTESDHDHKHKHSDEATHRDYQVAQQLTCDRIETDDRFTSPLTGRFPEFEALTIEWVGPSGQGSTLMTPSAGSFTLGE